MAGFFGSITSFILKLVGLVISPVVIGIIVIFIMFFVNYIFFRFFKRLKPKKLNPDTVFEKKGIIKRLFIEFPQMLAKDYLERDPNAFPDSLTGLHMICGEQGSGKTISVIHKLLQLKKRYPLLKIRSNMDIKFEDGKIEHWKQVVENTNGEYGQIEVLDEIQNWFNSNDSKNFPPEMLTEITQQRKQRKMLLGTSQVYSRIAKPIREQVKVVYLPMTIFGCLTFIRKSKPAYWDDNKQVFKKYIGWEFFVHNDIIRNSFDTYKKILHYSKVGFKDNVDMKNNTNNTINLLEVIKK